MLIDEIEESSKRLEEIVPLADSKYWPRIRAALLAAREMDENLRNEGFERECQRQFSEAMGES